MPHCYITRQLDLGEPLELDIRVEYSYTSFSTSASWDHPGDPCEIDIDDVICDQLWCIGLTGDEEDRVLQHAAENEYDNRADLEEAAAEYRYARQFDD